jgi:S-adenosylmethionine/arginine decarboxylase-like enzyme
MVQMYNPNVVGKQVIIDVKNIESDRLKTIANIQPLMEKIVEEFKLSVVAKSEFQFEKDNVPNGCTIMYLLSESHLFVHTFVDEGKITLDLFTCSLGAACCTSLRKSSHLSLRFSDLIVIQRNPRDKGVSSEPL